MSVPRCNFHDAAAVLADYDFEINPSEEEPEQNRLSIERTATTDGVGFVRQQGDSSPKTKTFTGSILTQTQKDAMDDYRDACAGRGTPSRTVFFTDPDGTQYEVMITNFAPRRIRVVRNPRDPALLWKWTYTLEMDIVAVVGA